MSKGQPDNEPCSGRPMPDVAHAVPELPAWKAFVVQFSRDAGARSGICAGRVEHLSSGRRARFASRDELLEVLTRLLADLGEPPK